MKHAEPQQETRNRPKKKGIRVLMGFTYGAQRLATDREYQVTVPRCLLSFSGVVVLRAQLKDESINISCKICSVELRFSGQRA